MCGICGFYQTNPIADLPILKLMNDQIIHRGPDDEGFYFGEKIGLAARRLSVIDLVTGHQPLSSHSGKSWITFNGEVYNFMDLREELESRGFQFKTRTDTEVVVNMYEAHGLEFVHKLRGMFAIGIYDSANDRLVLVRDHVGIKPLYYYFDAEKKNLIFASEIKSILKYPSVPREIDPVGLDFFLTLEYIPAPYSIFKGIKKLPAGHFLTYENGTMDIKKYWEVKPKKLTSNFFELKDHFFGLLAESVKMRMIADVPLGAFLSGGIDSSIVLDRVSSLRSGIETFSIGFDLSKEEESEKFNADFDLAKRTADLYGAKHNEVVLNINDVVDNFEKTVWHLDEPISNPTMMSMMKLAHFAKEKVDVVLGGDGGDELFGGYPRYKYNRILDTYQMFMPSFARNILSRNSRFEKLNTKQGVDRMERFMFQKDEILYRVINNDILDPKITREFFEDKYFSNISSKQSINNFMNTDRRSWLVDYSLMLTDKITMSATLEERVPLLDKELVEYAATIPDKYKVNIFDTKMILKEAFKNDLPKFVLSQPKRGWISPGAKWLRQEKMYNMTKNILSPDYYEGTKDLFKWNEVKTILDDHCEQKQYNLTIIWALLTFQVWARRYNIVVS